MSVVRKCLHYGMAVVRKIIYSKPVYPLVNKLNRFIINKMPGFSGRLERIRNRLHPERLLLLQQEMAYEQAMEAEDSIAADTQDGQAGQEQRTAWERQQQELARSQWEAVQWKEELEDSKGTPLVSVIVPNFNHAPYLRERLDTIYSQTYPNFEVILLDDCSTDDSRDILNEYAQKYSDITRVAFNEVNAGKVFLQWNKGLSLARGEYIWIAESDDYSSPDFIETLMKYFCRESCMIAFARSVFMQEGKQIWSTEEYLADVKRMRWDAPFTLTASTAVRLGFGYKNIIPNVSSAIFRNIGRIPDEVIETCSSMHLSSDWIFYLSLIKGGTLSYTNETVNYYRVHPQSTSLKVQHTMEYYDEYETVSAYVAANYQVEDTLFEQVLKYLLWHYKATQHVTDAEIVREHYRIERLKEIQRHRKPNIAMACFSLQSGGGETYPLYLANELHRQGCNVTLIDFNLEKYEGECRKLLAPGIPLVRLRKSVELVLVLQKLNVDVIHTHHGSVDEITGKLLNNSTYECKHVITLHGMYETIDDEDLAHLFDMVGTSCSTFFYIADKNLEPFRRFGMLDRVNIVKIDNGLPEMEVSPVSRDALGIDENSFVLCIVSRGIAEKGWKEGIEAVGLARQKCGRAIDLVIVGDGDIRRQLEPESPEYIHFVGYQRNTRDYFAMADIGFLPTRFKGESYPLVLIEALMCGKPVIATDIAEVRHQLTDEEGNLAGVLLHLTDSGLNIEEIADAIVALAGDEDQYRLLQSRTHSASLKFDISCIVKRYLEAYQNVTGLGMELREE